MNDIKRLSHTNDPQTSRDALHEPTRKSNLKKVLRAVSLAPGRTANELAGVCSLESYEVRRRLSDLKNQCKVVHGPSRKCRSKGSTMVTWNLSGSTLSLFK